MKESFLVLTFFSLFYRMVWFQYKCTTWMVLSFDTRPSRLLLSYTQNARQRMKMKRRKKKTVTSTFARKAEKTVNISKVLFSFSFFFLISQFTLCTYELSGCELWIFRAMPINHIVHTVSKNNRSKTATNKQRKNSHSNTQPTSEWFEFYVFVVTVRAELNSQPSASPAIVGVCIIYGIFYSL